MTRSMHIQKQMRTMKMYRTNFVQKERERERERRHKTLFDPHSVTIFQLYGKWDIEPNEEYRKEMRIFIKRKRHWL